MSSVTVTLYAPSSSSPARSNSSNIFKQFKHLAQQPGQLLPAVFAVPRLKPLLLAALGQVHHNEYHILVAEEFSAEVAITPVDKMSKSL